MLLLAYRFGSSVLHRAAPTAKLLSYLMVSTALVAARGLGVALPGAVVLIAAWASLARSPGSSLLGLIRALRPILVLAVVVFLSHLLPGGVAPASEGLTRSLRIILLGTAAHVLLMTTSLDAVRRSLRFPPGHRTDLGLLVVVTVRFLQILVGEARQMETGLRLRGMDGRRHGLRRIKALVSCLAPRAIDAALSMGQTLELRNPGRPERIRPREQAATSPAATVMVLASGLACLAASILSAALIFPV